MRFITVNQEAIASDAPAIHVHNARTEHRYNCRELRIMDRRGDAVAVVRQAAPGGERQDGARVWIEVPGPVESLCDESHT